MGKDSREATDSTQAEKPIFTTKKVRHVYGGGGITPDIFSELDLNFNESTREILSHPDRLIFQFAGELKNDIEEEYETFEDFTTSYQLKNKRRNIFFLWLKNQEIDFEAEQL